ncbi:MAG: hypothetical protein ABI051_16545 [Vicinamibacterales bacterium]
MTWPSFAAIRHLLASLRDARIMRVEMRVAHVPTCGKTQYSERGTPG